MNKITGRKHKGLKNFYFHESRTKKNKIWIQNKEGKVFFQVHDAIKTKFFENKKILPGLSWKGYKFNHFFKLRF